MLVSFDPRDTPEAANAKKRAHLAALGRPRNGERLALPDRRRGVDPSASRRLPGSPISGTQQTSQFAHVSGAAGGDRRRHGCRATSTASSTRPRICGWRWSIRARARSARSSRSCCSTASTTTRRTGRYGAALMNMVRLGGVLTVALDRRVHRADAAPRDRDRPRKGTPERCMWSGFRCFLSRRRRWRHDVDKLYFFIVAVTAFFAHRSSRVLVDLLRGEVPHQRSARRRRTAFTGSIPLELAWSVIPFLISIVIFVWAADVFFDLQRPPDQTLEIYSTGKRWMWKFQHLDGQSEINELHVPIGRSGQGDVHVGGRAALAVLPVVPREGRRDSGTLQHASGSRRRRSASTTSSAPSTAARTTPA